MSPFEDDGVVRDGGGDPGVHRGPAELRRYFSTLLSKGGLTMDRCFLTEDHRSCALEYNVIGWGGALPSQAGLAVYEHAQSGRLASARIYDDIERPSFN